MACPLDATFDRKNLFVSSHSQRRVARYEAYLLRQRKLSLNVTDYYMEMLGLWKELDLNEEEDWESVSDSIKYQTKLENERVLEFLACLNQEVDDVWSRILGQQPYRRRGRHSLRSEKRHEGGR